ncbi:MAG: YchF/TatD family DNA exonuclease [Nitrospirae bacterium]|nr:YchF/TatD family DNA exonuclease [Nitrospirota bacterium]
MIDTHCHLEMKPFDDDREEVIKRAKEAGLEAVITIGSDFNGCKGAVELAEKYDFVYATVGIHPHDAKDFNEDVFNQLKAWAKGEGLKAKGKVVAIGETGIDYHYDHSPRDVQKEIFIKQLGYAVESDMPAIIHSREAKEDTLKILKESRVSKGVLHCFSGDMETAEKAMEMGLYISFAGTITFKKALQIQEIAKVIPDEYLLIETDAPYLAPEPFRGKRNEPAFVKHTAEFIAKLRGVSLEDIDRITTLNAKRLFGIGGMPERGEITYKIRDSLYLNITNRCTSKCSFCIKFHSDFVKGHNLRLAGEPSADELKSAIGDPALYKEVVFCGYGEPLLRLDMVKEVASWIKEKGGKVRINTSGHGNLIHKRNILPELQGLVDSISISLDAHDEETYNKICNPAFKNAFAEVVNFIKESKKYIPEVIATVVTAEGVDVNKCKEIADSLGVKLRVRRLDVVG